MMTAKFISVGKIQLTATLWNWLGNDRVYLDVYCSDGVFTAGPQTMEVVILNIRLPPIFQNVPSLVVIPEDETVGTSIYKVLNFKILQDSCQ